jgi:hypothetical protein
MSNTSQGEQDKHAFDYKKWSNTVKQYVLFCEKSDNYDESIKIILDMFNFITKDFSWKKCPKLCNFFGLLGPKLIEFKNNINCTPSDTERFRNIEEKLGIFKYCHSITVLGYRCGNKINIKKRNNYCHLHKKFLSKQSKEISKFIYSSDLCMLIAQYI